MDSEEFLSFKKALNELSLPEEDLKRLISAGEIRAFREGSKMKLRAEDVERVRTDLGGAEELVGDDLEPLEADEILFSDEDVDAGMATTQLSEEDTILDDLEVVELDAADDEFDSETIIEDAPAPTSAGRSRRARAAEEEPVESGGQRALLILTSVLMLYGVALAMAVAATQSNSMVDPLVNMLAN